VASLVAAIDRPWVNLPWPAGPAGADPARAVDGSNAVNATAATVATTAARPTDENKVLRANISMSSEGQRA
jgi:hypothetical protein